MQQPLLVVGIILGYFAVWLTVSYLSSRGADNLTFFTGNRRMPWPLVAVAMIGAPITGVTLLSVPGMVAAKGYSYLQMGLGFIAGYLIISLVLIPLYYRLNIYSIYEYLHRRFNATAYKTGAWLFFVSKIVGISIRFLMVCLTLQLLLFDPLGVPYVFSVLAGIALVWLSTFRGGVKSVIWGDVLKSLCLLLCVGLCLYYIISALGFSASEVAGKVATHQTSRVFFFDDPSDSKFFWKEFIAGIVIVIAMTGLDQDMMQRTLSCRNARASFKNMMVGSVMQVVVIALLLVMGSLMVLYIEQAGEALPAKSDNLFATVAFHEGIPIIVGILFVIGLISATYSSLASALTSMTTTMTIDIMGTPKDAPRNEIKKRRTRVHIAISAVMALLVIFFYYLNSDDAISTVYTLISYTDGPILGLFLFGILTSRSVNTRWLPAACMAAPLLAWAVQWLAAHWFDYTIGYELLIVNAAFTFAGLYLLSSPVKMPLEQEETRPQGA